jgi:pyruvate dehydrogenase E2 component (dihydrolipoamide acetyltransferase)
VSVAWAHVPHVAQFDRADVTELESFRAHATAGAEEQGARLTLTAVLVKVAAMALLQFPRLNASLDMARGELVLKRYVHVGVAVDTEAGLLVPVVRDADRKGLVELAKDLGSLSARARDRKLTAEEMEGASFTVTNLGGLGTTHFTPIVPWPQVAILSVGRARTEVLNVEDRHQARKVLPLGVTYDHRALDGADAARFLRWVCEALEEPMRLLV